jgi:hypothetical protein
MSISPQSGSDPTKFRKFNTFQTDISTVDTQKAVSVGRTNQPGMPYNYEERDAIGKEQGRRVQGKKSKSKKIYFFTLILLLLCIIGSSSAFFGYQTYSAQYQNDLSLAQTGVKHLETATTLLKTFPKNPLDAQTISQAHYEFLAASTVFIQLENDLKSLPVVIISAPIFGARLSTALHIVPLALEVSQAGVTSCNALALIISRLHDPLNSKQGLTMADFDAIEKDFQQIKGVLNLTIGQINSLQPTDMQLDPRIRKLVTTFHQDLPAIKIGLAEVEQLLPVVPALLGIGTPANYLIEILDSSELRPAGGFIGNYGIATFSGGRLATAHITDTYLIDNAFTASGHSIPYPSAYKWFNLAPQSWSLRDSNLDANFPSDAHYAEQNFTLEGGNVPVEGVTAITPALIQHALTVTGPINIPEYHETVTTQNLIDRIHYYQLGPGRQGSDVPSPDRHSSVRKHFTELLAEHFLARVHQLPASVLPRLLQVLVNGVHSKDLQIYFNSAIAENLLQRYHLDASIQAPAGDSLFVVDANISPNKASPFIRDTLDDQVTIDGEGTAIHHTTISYNWNTAGQVYGSRLYRDYIRVYAPHGSRLQAQSGWQPRGTSSAFGHQVWAGFFTLTYGQTRTITLVWSVPGIASRDAHGWHYQDEIQRQAGAQWTVHLQVTLPACAVISNKWGGLSSKTRNVAALTQPLNHDLTTGIDYTC